MKVQTSWLSKGRMIAINSQRAKADRSLIRDIVLSFFNAFLQNTVLAFVSIQYENLGVAEVSPHARRILPGRRITLPRRADVRAK
jgi:hypothetical protein